MNSKSRWTVALLVPFFIVALVWSMASVVLFQPSPQRDLLTHDHHLRGTKSPAFERFEIALSDDKLRTEPRASSNVMQSGLDSSLAPKTTVSTAIQKRSRQQIGPRTYSCNMTPSNIGTPVMPSYAPPLTSRQSSFLTAGQDNYLEAVSQDGNFRWSVERMPIRVFISDGGSVAGYRPEFRKMIADAFNEWCSNSHGLVSWTQVNNPRLADVVCTWTNNPTIKPGSVEAGQTRTLVQTNRETGEGRIVTAQISILTQFMGQPFSNENMYKTCLHEVGHALGLQGHSDVPSDIMYPTVNHTQTAQLKARDLNTLTSLYDVTGYTALYSPGAQPSEIGSVTPFTGGSQFDSNNEITPFTDQPDSNGITPFYGRRLQQQDGAGNSPFGGRRIILMQPGGQQWYAVPNRSFGNPQHRPHHHTHRDWTRRAAIREYMQRNSPQNGF